MSGELDLGSDWSQDHTTKQGWKGRMLGAGAAFRELAGRCDALGVRAQHQHPQNTPSTPRPPPGLCSSELLRVPAAAPGPPGGAVSLGSAEISAINAAPARFEALSPLASGASREITADAWRK